VNGIHLRSGMAFSRDYLSSIFILCAAATIFASCRFALAESPQELVVDVSHSVGDETVKTYEFPTPKSALCESSVCAMGSTNPDLEVLYVEPSSYNISPGQIVVAYALAINHQSTVATESRILFEVSGGEIIAAPGCLISSIHVADCNVGDMSSQQYSARSISVRPSGNPERVEFAASLSASNSQFPSASKHATSVVLGSSKIRLTAIESHSCPSISATVSETSAAGEPYIVWPTSHRFEEDNQSMAPFVDVFAKNSYSVAVLLDNSLTLTDNEFVAAVSGIGEMVRYWHGSAAQYNEPLPMFAVYTMSDNNRVGTYSSDPDVIEGYLASIVRLPGRASIYGTVALAQSDLDTHTGRKIALVASASTDPLGDSDRENLIDSLIRSNINIYGVAMNAFAEPLMRELSASTHGLRQSPSSPAALSTAFKQISDQLRAETKVQWTTPFVGPTSRNVSVFSNISFSRGDRHYVPSPPGCQGECLVTRVVESRISPEEDLVVTLELSASARETSFSVSEFVPYDWALLSAEHGGTYVPTTRRIEWTFAADQAPSKLTYTLRKLFNSMDELRFSGSVSAGSEFAQNCGTSVVQQLPFSPASRGFHPYRPSEHTANLAAYALAWKSGSPWVQEPSHIPASYVTRALQIERLGGAYVISNQRPPWIPTPAPVLPANRTSHRGIPAHYLPGVALPISMLVEPGTGSMVYTIEEFPPSGWGVDAISDGGILDVSGQVIRWGPFQDDMPRTLSYTLTPPSGVSGTVVFTGRLSVDGVDAEIEGATTLASARIFANGFD
jgi:hypothetical protein